MIYKKMIKMRLVGLDVQVDHRIPLRGKLVCGLHVHQNLRIVNSSLNKSKLNKFEVRV